MKVRYVVLCTALPLALVGAVIVCVKGCGGSVDNGETIATPSENPAEVPGRRTPGTKGASIVRGDSRREKPKGKDRFRTRSVDADDDDDDDDNISPADKRLLTAIEEGRDDDSLEKVLVVLPEASASTNAEVRSELVDALGWFGVPAMNHLLPFLVDSDDDVRQSAIDSWMSSLGEIEDEKMKAKLIAAVMQVLNDEDALESMTSELIGMDERIALQTLVDVIEGGKAPEQAVAAAKEQYEFLTGDEYTTVEDANKWLAENYEPPDKEDTADGN